MSLWCYSPTRSLTWCNNIDSSATIDGGDYSGDAPTNSETFVILTTILESWTCEQDYIHTT